MKLLCSCKWLRLSVSVQRGQKNTKATLKGKCVSLYIVTVLFFDHKARLVVYNQTAERLCGIKLVFALNGQFDQIQYMSASGDITTHRTHNFNVFVAEFNTVENEKRW